MTVPSTNATAMTDRTMTMSHAMKTTMLKPFPFSAFSFTALVFTAGVLSVSDSGNGESYADIARALASDYYKIYVVEPDSGDYIEYSSQAGGDELAIERHGTGFFEKAIADTLPRISENDRAAFLDWFTKENLSKAADGHGVSSVSYSLIENDSAMRVLMKANRMEGTDRIILGVSIMDVRTDRQL